MQQGFDQRQAGEVVLDAQHLALEGADDGSRALQFGVDAGRGNTLGVGHAHEGQFQGEARTDARLALHLESAVHVLQQAFTQCQAQAAAFHIRVGPQAFERLEQLPHMIGCDAVAGIAHSHADSLSTDIDLKAHLAIAPVVFDRIGQQVQQHLGQALAVGNDARIRRQCRQRPQLHACVGGHGRHQRQRLLQGARQRDRHDIQRQASGLDLGDVQHLVDQREQVLAGAQNVTDIGLLRLGRVHVQQLRKAQDRVERGPQFVAHARQELAFGAAGAFGFLAGGAQGDLRRAAVGDVAGDLGKTAQGAGAVVLRRDHHAGPEPRAVLAAAPAFFGVIAVAGGLAQRHVRVLRAFLGQVEQREMLADDLLLGIALDPLGAVVPTGDMARRVEGEDPVVLDPIDDQPQAFFVVAQGAFAFGQQQSGLHQAGAQLADFVFFRRLWQQRRAQGQALGIALHILHPGDNALGQKQHRDNRPEQPADRRQPGRQQQALAGLGRSGAALGQQRRLKGEHGADVLAQGVEDVLVADQDGTDGLRCGVAVLEHFLQPVDLAVDQRLDRAELLAHPWIAHVAVQSVQGRLDLGLGVQVAGQEVFAAGEQVTAHTGGGFREQGMHGLDIALHA